METNYELVHNEAKSRYEYHIEGHLAYVAYEEENGTLRLIQTSVPKALEGRGIAGALVKDVLEEIEKRALKMKPACSYIVSYVEKHPEYKRLL